ncbi:MAG TPA: hypothetical protein VN414_04305 [Methanosarcina sp.]|nr:hypothetical protein [Methanosarcina sp.]
MMKMKKMIATLLIVCFLMSLTIAEVSAQAVKPKITITHVPPYGVSGSASGIVKGVKPSNYKVAVYIYVGGWWNKPYWNSPLTKIKNNGTWSCNINTGGNDIYATRVAAFLVPAKYVPPKMAGEKSLPSKLYKNSVAYSIVKR